MLCQVLYVDLHFGSITIAELLLATANTDHKSAIVAVMVAYWLLCTERGGRRGEQGMLSDIYTHF